MKALGRAEKRTTMPQSDDTPTFYMKPSPKRISGTLSDFRGPPVRQPSDKETGNWSQMAEHGSVSFGDGWRVRGAANDAQEPVFSESTSCAEGCTPHLLSGVRAIAAGALVHLTLGTIYCAGNMGMCKHVCRQLCRHVCRHKHRHARIPGMIRCGRNIGVCRYV